MPWESLESECNIQEIDFQKKYVKCRSIFYGHTSTDGIPPRPNMPWGLVITMQYLLIMLLLSFTFRDTL